MTIQAEIIRSEDWQRCIEHWIAHVFAKSNSQETRRIYSRHLYRFLKNNEQPKMPDEFTRAEVENFVRRPSESMRSRGKPASVSAQNQRLAVLSSFYNYSASYMIVGEHGKMEPILRVPSPTIGVRRGRTKRVYHSLSAEEVTRLLSSIDRTTIAGKRDYALILAYVTTSRRRAELIRLKWGDISPAIINGKPSYQYRWFGKGKGQESDISEMKPEVYQAITKYLEADGRLASIQADDFIFLALPPRYGGGRASQGKDHLRPAFVSRRLKKYARLAGLSEQISCHWLRHTSVRLRLEAGEPIRAVSHALRHVNTATTDAYGHMIVSESDDGAQMVLDRVLGRPQERPNHAPVQRSKAQPRAPVVKEWMKPSEIARELSCSTDTILKLIHDGELPATQISQHYRVRRADLAAYLEAHQYRAINHP